MSSSEDLSSSSKNVQPHKQKQQPKRDWMDDLIMQNQMMRKSPQYGGVKQELPSETSEEETAASDGPNPKPSNELTDLESTEGSLNPEQVKDEKPIDAVEDKESFRGPENVQQVSTPSKGQPESEKLVNKVEAAKSPQYDGVKLDVISHSSDKPRSPIKKDVPIVIKKRFKNARQDVAVEYKVGRIPVPNGEPLNWDNCRIDDSCNTTDDEMALSFNKETSILKLTPSKSGDFTIIFTIESEYRLEYSLTVIADPRKLWDSKEPPEGSLYPKSHRESRILRIGERILAGASIRGRSHARDGTYRDDDFIICKLVDGWNLMLVADGAGSAKFSREGSRILVETMRDQLMQKLQDDVILADENNKASALIEYSKKINLKDNLLLYGAFASYKSINAAAEKNNAHRKDFNTTLISCLFKDFGEKTLLYSFCIGDGAIFAIEVDSGDVTPLNTADSGEFAGQTIFLTTPQVWEDNKSLYGRIKVNVVSKPMGIIGMTDGVSDPLLPDIEQINDAKHIDLLLKGKDGEDPLDGLIPVLSEMVDKHDAKILEDWLDFYVAGHHDDRTIALAIDPQILS